MEKIQKSIVKKRSQNIFIIPVSGQLAEIITYKYRSVRWGMNEKQLKTRDLKPIKLCSNLQGYNQGLLKDQHMFCAFLHRIVRKIVTSYSKKKSINSLIKKHTAYNW